jgi:glucosamine--fructose-6-phosphate aminotransferase (isomerizing)
MSGIVGYIGHRDAKPVILDALTRLEYRGYDSAGIGLLADGKLKVLRTLGRPALLAEKLSGVDFHGNIGIGHTRWATHGKPAVRNAHPQKTGGTAVVHNGILENAVALRVEIKAYGGTLTSETDTEVLPHLVNIHWKGNLLGSVLEALKRVEGVVTCCFISERDPDNLVAVRKGNPLVVGLGEGEQIVASDATAISPYTNKMVYLRDGEIALLSHEGAQFFDFSGQPVEQAPQIISWTPERAEKRGYRHFLLKEIVESPRAVRETLAQCLPMSKERLMPEDFCFPHADLKDIDRVIFCGSGSSYFAAMLGQQICDSVAGISTSRVVASEFRYGARKVEKDALHVLISQSGESLDTLESARYVTEQGGRLMVITNNPSSSLGRMADYPFVIQAGPEVSVASSKTFSAMVAALALLAFHLGRENGNLSAEEQEKLLNELKSIPEKMEVTVTSETVLRRIAERYAKNRSFFFIGRGLHYPVALYAALMMKEVANVHGEALMAGEIKHGAISIIEKGSPVMFFANQEFLKKRIMNDIDELKARGAVVVATGVQGGVGAGGQDGRLNLSDHCDQFISVPGTDDRLSPLLSIVPAQLFIYYLGLYNRKDIDRPRNIAKSVTV